MDLPRCLCRLKLRFVYYLIAIKYNHETEFLSQVAPQTEFGTQNSTRSPHSQTLFGDEIASETPFRLETIVSYPMRSNYKITDKDGLYFITSTIVEWLHVFTSQAYFDIIIQSLKHCQHHKGLQLYAYVILDNHFHLIVAGESLARTITDFKKFTARQIIDQATKDNKTWLLNQLAYYKKRHKINSQHQVWQEGYHPQLIFSEEVLVQKMDYIHYNPVKRGLVTLPEHWIYSSARNYLAGDDSVIILDPLPV